MEFEESPLYGPAMEIQQNSTGVHYTWQAVIHAGGQDIVALKVTNYDCEGDYLTNFADEERILLYILPSQFFKYVAPNAENLEVTVMKYPTAETTGDIVSARPFLSQRYMATYNDRGNPVVQGDTGSVNNPDALDVSDMVPLELQLIQKAVYYMRLKQVARTYRRKTTEDAIRTLLTTESLNLPLAQEDMPLGVDMVPGDNQVVREHIAIPQKTQLIEAPAYIHRSCGGVYSSGFNYYYSRKMWYVYPSFNTERFAEKGGVKLTILNIPKNKLPESERTFLLEGKSLMVLSTADSVFSDTSNTKRGNLGNGVRFANADNFMDASYAKMTDNRAYLSRGNNNTEIITTPIPTGLNNVMVSDRSVTSNPYVEYSALAAREGSTFAAIWENSDPSLIYPGMPARVYYIDGNEVKELRGILIKANSFTRLRGFGMSESRYKTDTVLVLYVRRQLE